MRHIWTDGLGADDLRLCPVHVPVIDLSGIECLSSLGRTVRVVMVFEHGVSTDVSSIGVLLYRLSHEVHAVVRPQLVWCWEVSSGLRRSLELWLLCVVEGLPVRPRSLWMRRSRVWAVVVLDHL